MYSYDLSKLKNLQKAFSNELEVIDFSNKEVQNYYNFYKLPQDSTLKIKAGFKRISNYQIFLQIFTSGLSKEITLLIHGFYDHSSVNSKLINYLTSLKQDVIVLDLPGHGLSSGEPLEIDDFSDYSNIISSIINSDLIKSYEKINIISHSLGSAVTIDFLSKEIYDKNKIEKVILIAPLVRSKMWYFSKFGYYLTYPFTNHIPRFYRDSSSDPEFNNFREEEDFLQFSKTPLNWFSSLKEWEEKINKIRISKRKILILQGEMDGTVDWKHNTGFIREKFPKSKIIFFPRADHHLQNEKKTIRDKVFMEIKKYLE